MEGLLLCDIIIVTIRVGIADSHYTLGGSLTVFRHDVLGKINKVQEAIGPVVLQFIADNRQDDLYRTVLGCILATVANAHLTLRVRPLVLGQWIDILISGLFDIIGVAHRFRVREGIGGIAVFVFFYDREVQVALFHLALVIHVLHTVTIIRNDCKRILGIVDQGDTLIVLNGRYLLNLLQTQVQLSVLEVEQLTTTVGRTGHEVVEALIILHQIGLYELIVLGRLHILQLPDTGLQQDIAIEPEGKAFCLQDIVTELFADIGLTVLVERHQLVKTIDGQLHEERSLTTVPDQLRQHLKHIIVLGDSRLLFLHGLVALRLDGEGDLSPQQQVHHLVNGGEVFGFFDDNSHFCLDVSWFVDLTIELDTVETDVICRLINLNFLHILAENQCVLTTLGILNVDAQIEFVLVGPYI